VLVQIIKGIACKRGRQEASITARTQVADSPLIRAVVAFSRQGGSRSTCSRLLSQLTRVAAEEGIVLKGKPWPKNEDSLGKMLSQCMPLLSKLGVPIQRNMNDRPRTWTIPDTSSVGDANAVATIKADIATSSNTAGTSPLSDESSTEPYVGEENFDDSILQEVIHRD
jgi:hypothetical protein